MTGALIILGKNVDLDELNETGITIDGKISALMLESIFQKSSPLHDGAVIIHNTRIQSAGCILPISKNPNIPTGAGLRHRAGLGITESTQSLAIIVSEETGETSVAENAKLFVNVSESFVREKIEKYLN
jgi:DNA integrity scanning protein DisA with diadenylate cyclase activity